MLKYSWELNSRTEEATLGNERGKWNLNQCYSKYGTWTRSIPIGCEVHRNIASLALLQFIKSESEGWDPGHCVLTVFQVMLCCSVIQSCSALWDPMGCSTPGFPVLYYLRGFAQTHVHWVSDTIQTSQSLSPFLLLPSIFPSLRNLSSELALHIRWPKCKSFSFSISPFSEYSGLTSLNIEWFDLLVVQGTLKGLLQHHKVSVLWCSTFFMVQLSQLHMTMWKNHSFD